MKAAKFFTLMLAMAAGMGLVPVGVRAEVVTVRSGNGAMGGPDALITFLGGDATVQLRNAPFSTTDFNAANNGPAAVVVSPHPAWLVTLAKDPDAKWVSVDATRGPASALYAIDFKVSKTNIESATLDFSFVVDDSLGDVDDFLNPIGPNRNGLYLRDANGVFNIIPGTSGVSHVQATNFEGLNITGMISVGENTLYIYNRDRGAAVSGVIFSATINIYDQCLLAGDKDDFGDTNGLGDTLNIRPLLAQWLARSNGNNCAYHNCNPMPFDADQDNEVDPDGIGRHWDWDFGYTFMGLPELCSGAKLRIHLKALPGISTTTNDVLWLQYTGDGTTLVRLYAINLGDLEDALFGTGPWNSGDVAVFELELGNLPPSGSFDTDLIDDINQVGYLDIMVLDDTAVDYIELCYNPCNCIDPPPDMVAWYTGDFGPNDLLGNHHGIPVGFTHAWIPKVGPGTLAFSPGLPPAYVKVPHAASLNFAGAFSCDAWFLLAADDTGWYPIVSKLSSTGGVWDGYEFLVLSNTLTFRSGVQGGSQQQVLSTGTVPTGVWTHGAVTVDTAAPGCSGATPVLVTFYLNGLPAGNTCVAPLVITNTDPLWLGHGLKDTTFDGPIDEIEIFNRALTGSEVQAIYQADSAGKCKCVEPPPNMVAWWTGDNDLAFAVDALDNHHGSFAGDIRASVLDPKVGDGALFFSDFPGGISYIEVPNAPGLNFETGGLTIDLWLRTSADGYRPIIEYQPNNNPAPGYALRLQGGKLNFVVCDNLFTCGSVVSVNTVNNGTWRYVAATLTRGPTSDLLDVYIDGLWEAQTVVTSPILGSINSTSDCLLIGAGPFCDPPGPNFFFDGDMDEIEIFKRALDPSDILAIFQAGSAGKCKCVEPPPNMVAWWPLDETSGTTATEIVNGNDGTHVNAPTPLSGELVDNSLCFDGINEYIVVPNDPSLNFGTGGLTIDLWTRTTETGYRPIVENGFRSRKMGYLFYLNGGKVGFEVCSSVNICGSVVSATTVNDGNWRHITGTFSRGATADVLTVYIDGAQAGLASFSAVGSINSVADDLLIGADGWPTPIFFFDGCMDEIEFFSRALTQAEIQVIYQAGSAGKCKFVECTDCNDCGDGDVCTCDLCVAGLCDNPPRGYGDIDCDDDIDLFDLFCLLNGFSGDFSTCCFSNIDIEPCAGDGDIDLFDLFAVLNAFSGIDPCCSGPMPASPPVSDLSHAGSIEASHAVISLVPVRRMVRPGEVISVDVFVSGVSDLRGYEVAIEVTDGRLAGGRSVKGSGIRLEAESVGRLEPESLVIENERTDYVFGQLESFQATDDANVRMVGALLDGSVTSKQDAYLGTITFRASQDARGTFRITVRPDKTVLLDSAGKEISVRSIDTSTISVR